MTRRVMIHVQHLLGTGHLKRMSLLANALAKAEQDVTLVSGGLPAPQIAVAPEVRFVQLPPVRTIDAAFSGLADDQGKAIDDAFRSERTGRLLEVFDQVRPDALIVELFPLGRRQLRFELLPLLERARPRTGLIACSVRDIVNRRPHREAEALDWLNAFFDLLLVHGDEALTPIADSVPGIASFGGEVLHTGYIAEPLPPPLKPGQPEILVSAGGGASGAQIFEAAVGASALHDGPEVWRIRHGAGTSEDVLAQWRQQAAPSAILEPVAADFTARLQGASLSVSQFGYNTAVELMQTTTPALAVPYRGEGETEQSRRAEALAPLGFGIMSETALSAEALAAAARRALDVPARQAGGVNLGGIGAAVRRIAGG
ncbi:MAG: glycosyltransferase family protein [Minwuia sp.]|uniref:glycosyltransferase family protein n=1 Tax=Minwuia sp. TaxID=2493630 RepID=UPI003A8A0B5E